MLLTLYQSTFYFLIQLHFFENDDSTMITAHHLQINLSGLLLSKPWTPQKITPTMQLFSTR